MPLTHVPPPALRCIPCAELFQECEHCCTDDAQAAEIKVMG